MQEPTGADVKASTEEPGTVASLADVKASTEEPGKEEKPTVASLKSCWGLKGNLKNDPYIIPFMIYSLIPHLPPESVWFSDV